MQRNITKRLTLPMSKFLIFNFSLKEGSNMKKLLAGLSLGALLVGGIVFTSNPVDLTMDKEPSVLRTVIIDEI